MMNDLIIRQRAIEAIMSEKSQTERRTAELLWFDLALERACEIVNELLPAQQWTPVNDPPKESGFYLITNDRGFVKIKWFNSKLNLWSMDDILVPIAWMPLPEPYAVPDNKKPADDCPLYPKKASWSQVSGQATLCSNCGKAQNAKQARGWRYCPHCGAMMEQ